MFSLDYIQVLLTVLVGVICSHHTDSLKVWSYQVICMLISTGQDPYLSWFFRGVLTTGLSLLIYFSIKKLPTFNLPYLKTLLVLNFILMLYITSVLVLTEYNYTYMLWLYYSDIDLYIEYGILLTLINYKGLLTYVRININRFKYRVFKSNRGNSLAYKEVYEGKRWN